MFKSLFLSSKIAGDGIGSLVITYKIGFMKRVKKLRVKTNNEPNS